MELLEIRNRRDFMEAFQVAMSGAHENLRRLWTFEKEQNLPKSYLIEFHPKPNGDHDHNWTSEDVYSALKRTGRLHNAMVDKTEDESLLLLSHQEPQHEAEFIVDCLNPRFLALHTISNAESTDRFILNRLTKYQAEFDLFWFPVALLENIEYRERIIGWEVQFEPLVDGEGFITLENEEVVSDQIIEEANGDRANVKVIDRPRLDMKFGYPDALTTYKQIRNVPDLLPDFPLTAVITARSDEQGQDYARARIRSDGKITGRGPDFYAYLQIVNGTLDNYADIVQKLEQEYWIKLEPRNTDISQGIGITGKPFCIRFLRTINVPDLIDIMFNCKPPFRLMGVPERIEDDFYSIDAIDLHVNQRVGIEISSTFMRIYLYNHTCGNTLVRIIRSLQHRVDSKLIHPELVTA